MAKHRPEAWSRLLTTPCSRRVLLRDLGGGGMLAIAAAVWFGRQPASAQDAAAAVAEPGDHLLTCRDCGRTFVFTLGEQAFYRERDYSEPQRCPACRAARKADRSLSGGYGGSGDPDGPRRMYPVICSSCGKETEVPYEPRAGCRECFQQGRTVDLSAGADGSVTEAYCVKGRAKREIANPHEVTMKNGRTAIEGTCSVCGTKLFRLLAPCAPARCSVAGGESGTIETIRYDKGFGFIGPDPEFGDELLFFHRTGVEDDGFDWLRVGQRVSFEAEADPRNLTRQRAVHVKPLDDA